MTINAGKLTDGVVSDLETNNQSYVVIREMNAAGDAEAFDVDFTFSGLTETETRIFFKGRYDGSQANYHKVEVRMWNYQTSAWDDMREDEYDLPSATVDYFREFVIPGTVADYFSGSSPNITAKIKIIHTSPPKKNHWLYIDMLGLGVIETLYTAPDNAGIDDTRQRTIEIKAKTDNLPADPASQAKIDFVEKWILNRLVESADGTTFTLYEDDGTTPLKVWAYNGGTKTRSKAT